MNGIVSFRKCTLTDEELLTAVDEATDKMYETQKVPVAHIPARPDSDYDLLVGELLVRFKEKCEQEKEVGKYEGTYCRVCDRNI